ncbi:NAD(P)-dependent oxidoreductase, partial [Bacillus subtilis]|nr:NAD(P)-dependent oxidoreductase [Bacillus subtilis]
VLGLGRVGMSVARSFAALGANVKVGARKSEHLARIAEMGLQPFYLSELDKEIADSDICINTIPYPILTAKTLSNVPT